MEEIYLVYDVREAKYLGAYASLEKAHSLRGALDEHLVYIVPCVDFTPYFGKLNPGESLIRLLPQVEREPFYVSPDDD